MSTPSRARSPCGIARCARRAPNELLLRSYRGAACRLFNGTRSGAAASRRVRIHGPTPMNFRGPTPLSGVRRRFGGVMQFLSEPIQVGALSRILVRGQGAA